MTDIDTSALTAPDTGTLALTDRELRLTRAARRLRPGAGELDRVLLVGGAVVLPLGLILIVLGWVGASRTTLVFEQNAYLISGGMLGLGLVFAGGFAYFAWWLTKLVREGREQHDRLVREVRAAATAAEHQAEISTGVLLRIEAALRTSEVGGGDGRAAGSRRR